MRHAFPGRREIEAAEFLFQLHRLIDDALLLFVVAQLDIAGERKILTQRMPLEAVIGEDAAQIGMIGKIDAVEIPGLALVPAGRAEKARDRRHRAGLVGHRLDADALIELHAQQVVDDVEPLGPFGIIDAADVDQDLEQAFRIVAQEGEQSRHRLALHRNH